jgi:hypothetical protein
VVVRLRMPRAGQFGYLGLGKLVNAINDTLCDFFECVLEGSVERDIKRLY